MSVFGIDYAWGRPSVDALRRAGVKYVCRYLSHDTTGKNLTRDEADRLSKAGIWIVVVWETSASRALSGKSGGTADARDALSQARACGMPEDRPIYFAVDFDATASQQGTINAYLDGAASVLGRDRIGLYAGYGPVDRALDAGKAKWAWQTYAWSGGRWDSRAHIQQYSNEHTLDGVSVDYDRAMKDDYGQWRVGVSPIAEDDMPDYVSVGAGTGQELKPGEWTTVNWKNEFSDSRGQHADEGGPSVLTGPAKYALTAALQINGLAPGTAVQARAIEVNADDTTQFEGGPVQDFVAGGDQAHVLYGLSADTVGKNYRVRFQVVQHGAEPATIASGSAKVLFWKS